MSYLLTLLREVVFVGFLVLIGGTIISRVLGRFFSVKLPSACKKWNKYHIMEISLFLTGAFVHIFCEFTGLNSWYCKRGAACLR